MPPVFLYCNFLIKFFSHKILSSFAQIPQGILFLLNCSIFFKEPVIFFWFFIVVLCFPKFGTEQELKMLLLPIDVRFCQICQV